MSTFFSSRWFLAASAEVLFPGTGAVARTVAVGGLLFDALLFPDGSVADNPLSDFYEPRPPDIPPHGDVARVPSLPRVARARVEVTRPPTPRPGLVPSPYVDWRAFPSWEAFVARCSGREWGAFKIARRKRRKLERSFGPVRLDLDLPDHALVELALIHKARQLRQTERLDRFASRRVRQFVHRLVEERHLTLSVLWAGDHPLAFSLAHWAPDRLSSWITSYDAEAAEGSPGTLLYEGLMEESWSRRHAEFDFLIGHEPYKYHYATHERLVGAIGNAPLRQRLADGIRRALEADARPRRLRRAAYGLVRDTLQSRLARERAAPIDDAAFRDIIEAHAPGWPWPTPTTGRGSRTSA